MTCLGYDWKPQSNKPPNDVAFAIINLINHLVKTQSPELITFFPFQGRFHFEYFFGDDNAIFKLISLDGTGIPSIGVIKENHIISNARSLRSQTAFPSFSDVNRHFPQYFSPEEFTYIGSHKDMTFSWQHFEEYITDYLNAYVLPHVMELNRRRVLGVIPTAPQYETQKILNSIYVIETPSTASQGSCFMLKNFGLVSCAHCIADDSFIYKASDIGTRFSVEISKKNDTIDIALFSAKGLDSSSGLEIGDSDTIQLNDHIAVAGFPNHNYGDTGIFSPGLIIGFRTVSSIRRFLTNIPLIAGNSGGPIISSKNKVIGVAVTGADKMENAGITENHGIIPINALRVL